MAGAMASAVVTLAVVTAPGVGVEVVPGAAVAQLLEQEAAAGDISVGYCGLAVGKTELGSDVYPHCTVREQAFLHHGQPYILVGWALERTEAHLTSVVAVVAEFELGPGNPEKRPGEAS